MENNQPIPPLSYSGNLGQITKKEKYLLKKQKKDQERFSKARRKKIKKIIISSLAILIMGGIVFGLVSYFSREKEETHSGIPKIEIDVLEYDVGTVSMADGLVKHTYEIKNIGEGDLKINGIRTSCMCTTARLKVGDKESGEFGMHSNPAFWSQKIAPGETGYLKVVFDPAFHGPDGTGSIIRAVYLSTDDPDNKEVEVRLIVNVIK